MKDAAVDAHSGPQFLSRYGIGTRGWTEVAALTQLRLGTKERGQRILYQNVCAMEEERHNETKDAAVEAHSGQRFLSIHGVGTRGGTEVAALTQLGLGTNEGAGTTDAN